MIRVRMPGGVCTPKQWLAMDDIADEHGNSTFKLTTRQTFQFHGIVKKHLKPAMQAINKSLLDTIAACGDVSEYGIPLQDKLTGQTVTSNVQLTLTCPISTKPFLTSQKASLSTYSPQHRPITRSGSIKRRLAAMLYRTLSRSTARPTCRESSRSPSLSLRTMRLMSSPTTSGSSPLYRTTKWSGTT
jgi:hypothetical protein